MIVWNARKIISNNFLVFLSTSYLCMGIINFFHLLAYKGMPIFIGYGDTLSSQLWIAGRLLLSVSLITSFFFVNRNFNEKLVLGLYLSITLILLSSIFIWRIFPITFVPGVGLTPFKIISEYIISTFFVIGLVRLYLFREKFDHDTYRLFFISFVFNIIAELLFTHYSNLFEFITLVAHTFVLFSYYLVYKAIIQVGLSKPYGVFFNEIQYISQQKDELLSIASHELKNPLTTIRIYSQILNKQNYDAANPDKISHIASQIQSQTERISRIVDDMNDVGKIETGRLVLKKGQYDLYTICRDIVRGFRRSTPTHKIILKRGQSVMLDCDRERICQVLVNLIANAIKYSPEGSRILIKVDLNNGQTVVSVKDHGIGILKDKIPHVFDKYYRTARGERKADGLGLGLYIAKQIIHQHSGRIWVDSTPNQGSTFYFSLPYLFVSSKSNKHRSKTIALKS